MGRKKRESRDAGTNYVKKELSEYCNRKPDIEAFGERAGLRVNVNNFNDYLFEV